MNYKVSAPDLAHLSFNETNTLASILQNIAVILATPKGTVPMARDFGVDMDFLDRAKVLRVTEGEDPMNGKLIPTVEVEINDEQE